jgi:hypothetical protein
MGFVVYKLNKISLEPDEYGAHLKIKMMSKYNEEGKYVKHIKLDEKAIEILKNSFLMPTKKEKE